MTRKWYWVPVPLFFAAMMLLLLHLALKAESPDLPLGIGLGAVRVGSTDPYLVLENACLPMDGNVVKVYEFRSRDGVAMSGKREEDVDWMGFLTSEGAVTVTAQLWQVCFNSEGAGAAWQDLVEIDPNAGSNPTVTLEASYFAGPELTISGPVNAIAGLPVTYTLVISSEEPYGTLFVAEGLDAVTDTEHVRVIWPSAGVFTATAKAQDWWGSYDVDRITVSVSSRVLLPLVLSGYSPEPQYCEYETSLGPLQYRLGTSGWQHVRYGECSELHASDDSLHLESRGGFATSALTSEGWTTLIGDRGIYNPKGSQRALICSGETYTEALQTLIAADPNAVGNSVVELESTCTPPPQL